MSAKGCYIRALQRESTRTSHLTTLYQYIQSSSPSERCMFLHHARGSRDRAKVDLLNYPTYLDKLLRYSLSPYTDTFAYFACSDLCSSGPHMVWLIIIPRQAVEAADRALCRATSDIKSSYSSYRQTVDQPSLSKASSDSEGTSDTKTSPVPDQIATTDCQSISKTDQQRLRAIARPPVPPKPTSVANMPHVHHRLSRKAHSLLPGQSEDNSQVGILILEFNNADQLMDTVCVPSSSQ